MSIISLIYSYSTRLWVALGKQPPTPSAAVPTLQEITNHIKSLYGCALVFRELEGNTIAAEVNTVATEVLLAMQVLLESYSVRKSGEDSMRNTASLHEACERARNLSVDNREAALKIWKQDSDGLKDAIKELNSLLNPQSTENEVSDGWDELLGEDAGQAELSEDDISAIKKVRTNILSCIKNALSWLAA
ncbi:hypothetical protein M408DRAFT_149252 [Serendipita vermifera MAFF 305830]|uniref:Cyclin-D1-binding protein 1-like N-terminal domain-containing protein n=1 Tax=Serendipita vermifera MAFF 305830 TaxID=933852 RepID=A0A0C2X4V5_SERVB|nr:hypothetical protein M408DRAFT_149252 [Serendipita vermifera MAFF 305830]